MTVLVHPPEVADPQPKEPSAQVTLTSDGNIPTNRDIDKLRVLLATRYGDTDNAEALQVKEEYRKPVIEQQEPPAGSMVSTRSMA
ncbi:MAG: hypothetical protein HYU64_00095 [Armatimonadetes bacterium]|nr:hypothetical protein [Armatimonadota bacterium]